MSTDNDNESPPMTWQMQNSLFLYSMHLRPASLGNASSDELATMAFAKENSEKLMRLFQIFGAKFILEVCGAMGATWGSSEVLCLRSASNVWFWRPCALIVGVIFFVRWINQAREYVVKENIELFPTIGSSASGGGEGEEKPLLASQYLPDWLRTKK
ncbi:hypothetical protein ACHAWU_001925 [Discostella pseudostelligera]|uniref:Uncharacterized protein n=1 Tax=Discostella pseudostelligera TaxID=259834 RepID=A0ABD3MIH2_9STRA